MGTLRGRTLKRGEGSFFFGRWGGVGGLRGFEAFVTVALLFALQLLAFVIWLALKTFWF